MSLRRDLESAWWHFLKPEFDQPEEGTMTTMHRSLDGGEMHPGFVDECVECAPTINAELAGPTLRSGLPADSTFFEPEYGAPGPWWHRLWCRFIARWGRP